MLRFFKKILFVVFLLFFLLNLSACSFVNNKQVEIKKHLKNFVGLDLDNNIKVNVYPASDYKVIIKINPKLLDRVNFFIDENSILHIESSVLTNYYKQIEVDIYSPVILSPIRARFNSLLYIYNFMDKYNDLSINVFENSKVYLKNINLKYLNINLYDRSYVYLNANVDDFKSNVYSIAVLDSKELKASNAEVSIYSGSNIDLGNIANLKINLIDAPNVHYWGNGNYKLNFSGIDKDSVFYDEKESKKYKDCKWYKKDNCPNYCEYCETKNTCVSIASCKD